ncbi:hypothetical protein HAX54_053484 [Datura stramonium]|uniref:Histidine-containing phosphotransfer protein n=1 Tax=Datura stramonium TaxID=4076 RepID=A0ABS8T0H0_DATST|nr:hypothetical protein [Datura stramonium]
MADHFARYIASLRQALFDEKIVNFRFLELDMFETANPRFLEDICARYFTDVAEVFDLMVHELQGPPYNSPLIESLLNRLSARTFIFGAVKVTHQIDLMRSSLRRGDFEACKNAFEGIIREKEFLQNKLDNYLKARKQGPPDEIEDQPEYEDMDTDSE